MSIIVHQTLCVLTCIPSTIYQINKHMHLQESSALLHYTLYNSFRLCSEAFEDDRPDEVQGKCKEGDRPREDELFVCVHACMQYFLECHKSSVPVTLQDAVMALEVYETVTDKAGRQSSLANFEKEL